jgi:hypothetical protein
MTEDTELLEQQAAFPMPEGWIWADWGTCRSCGAQIAWLVNDKSGKRSPFDLDGTNHFATCPQADSWRKR